MFPELLARLRALSAYYQMGHWQVKNSVFYSDHLLLERLYNEAGSRIDQVAEKAVGITGDRASVNLKQQLSLMASMVASLPSEAAENSAYFQAALPLETSLQAFCKAQAPLVSLGVQNMLGDIADESEGRAYLIKQRLATNAPAPLIVKKV